MSPGLGLTWEGTANPRFPGNRHSWEPLVSLHTFPGLFQGCFQHKKRILFHSVGLVLPFHLCFGNFPTRRALPSTVFLEFCFFPHFLLALWFNSCAWRSPELHNPFLRGWHTPRIPGEKHGFVSCCCPGWPLPCPTGQGPKIGILRLFHS